MKIAAILFLALFLTGIQNLSVASQTVRLRQFAKVIDTKGNKLSGEGADAERRMQVFEAISRDLPWTAESLRQAGIILQHTNTENEPDDGEEYRSQEMHLFTFFLHKEYARLIERKSGALLGPYRYCRVMGLPVELDVQWTEDKDLKKPLIARNTISDDERMKRGFPFALLASYLSTNEDPLPDSLRTTIRDNEMNQLYVADQQTRSLFKKDEMIFNRTIERIGDSQRRARLYEVMAEDVLWNARTLFEAAQVMNRTKSTLKKQRKTHFRFQENHLLAFFLARQAYIRGERDAAPLIVESLNNYLRVSQMPESFRLKLIRQDEPRVCLQEERVSVEQWGKYEFPFHLGRVIKPLCYGK
ncbi:hypothetical protein [Undibacterium squillarum]|uniref:Uncharacterized protein n=1 Tax=Undibacterium squillarum TaxID=1131567 RepID=A0ABQ2XTB8_9BURK|nr:hypothetical protein [Undibacterium squillarum]GGX31636.1 hypothetical protein GCM10010946_05940 [Undibacterium squillarum]